MSNEIAVGKRVLFQASETDFRAGRDVGEMTPGIVTKELSWPDWEVTANGKTYVRPEHYLKLGTQDTDPAAWMLHDGFTSTPVAGVHERGLQLGCYICRDKEFATMGLPLCRPCPQCLRKQQDCGACSGTGGYPGKTPCTDCLATGKLGGMGHIAADDNVCDDCG